MAFRGEAAVFALRPFLGIESFGGAGKRDRFLLLFNGDEGVNVEALCLLLRVTGSSCLQQQRRAYS